MQGLVFCAWSAPKSHPLVQITGRSIYRCALQAAVLRDCFQTFRHENLGQLNKQGCRLRIWAEFSADAVIGRFFIKPTEFLKWLREHQNLMPAAISWG
jgi:hypothetical protein